jgi:hypothetical protein
MTLDETFREILAELREIKALLANAQPLRVVDIRYECKPAVGPMYLRTIPATQDDDLRPRAAGFTPYVEEDDGA